jgi:hypothetical protein
MYTIDSPSSSTSKKVLFTAKTSFFCLCPTIQVQHIEQPGEGGDSDECPEVEDNQFHGRRQVFVFCSQKLFYNIDMRMNMKWCEFDDLLMSWCEVRLIRGAGVWVRNSFFVAFLHLL